MERKARKGISRRDFLARVSLLGAAAAAAPGVLALRCGPSRKEILARAAAYDPALDCTDTTGLLPVEMQLRTFNQYVNRSPHETRYCFNCENFLEPERAGACGRCVTVKGPINPLGWCRAWAEARR